MTGVLLTQMEAWIASGEGQRYACTRQYPHPGFVCDRHADCVGCLMVAAALELRKGHETRAPSRDADHCDYPDCEQHNALVVENLKAALRLLDNGFKYPAEVCNIARGALAQSSLKASVAPLTPAQDSKLKELRQRMLGNEASENGTVPHG